jgi:Domain of unknown function (DUF1902)
MGRALTEKTIRIRLLRHKSGDLLMAVSEDLRGLVVHAHSEEEMEERLPGVVRDLLEAEGYVVANVSLVRDKFSAPP